MFCVFYAGAEAGGATLQQPAPKGRPLDISFLINILENENALAIADFTHKDPEGR